MPDTPLGPQAGTLLKGPPARRTAWQARARWAVHLGLLCSAAAALGTLQLLHVRVAYHAVVGLVFVGLVVVHLAQRRRTIARMATQLVRATTFVERRTRLAVSDLRAPRHHTEHAHLGDRGLGPRRADAAAAPTPLPEMAPHLGHSPRRLPRGARLASEEAPVALDDPVTIALIRMRLRAVHDRDGRVRWPGPGSRESR